MRDMTAAIIINDHKILLVHNTKHNGLRIEPPGGKREDELLYDCVIREVKEELGIDINVKSLLGVYKTYSPEGEFNVYMYLSEIADGEIMLREPDKISKYGWYSFNDLINFKDRGLLVPNLVDAIVDLKEYL